MHNGFIAGALGLLLLMPVASQAATSDEEVAELRRQVAALIARVEALEAAAPAPTVAPLSPPASTPPVAGATVLAAATRPAAEDWTQRLRLSGDLRYRHEQIAEDGSDDRSRDRLRARLGVEARLNDAVTAKLGVATGDPPDPRSSNVTLGDSNRRDDLRLDLAYVDWRPAPAWRITAGKQEYPWFRPGGSLLYDSDVRPEGLAVSWGRSKGPFVSAWGYWLSESLTRADASLMGLQAGWVTDFGLTLALSYHDYGNLRNSTLSFSGFPAGNSSYLGDANCDPAGPPTGITRCYLHDYDIVGLAAEYVVAIGGTPLQFWADYIENLDPGSDNSGYNLGMRLGRARDPGSWELRALYQDVAADAQWGGVVDSDFAAGTAQGQGLALGGGWVPLRNVTLNLTFFDTVRDYDRVTERDQRQLQLDFNFRF